MSRVDQYDIELMSDMMPSGFPRNEKSQSPEVCLRYTRSDLTRACRANLRLQGHRNLAGGAIDCCLGKVNGRGICRSTVCAALYRHVPVRDAHGLVVSASHPLPAPLLGQPSKLSAAVALHG